MGFESSWAVCTRLGSGLGGHPIDEKTGSPPAQLHSRDWECLNLVGLQPTVNSSPLEAVHFGGNEYPL